MRVLLLTPIPHYLADPLEAAGDGYAVSEDVPNLWPEDIDFLVSFGYRYILPQQVLDRYQGRAINIHISLLPWNRGADPNFWSWFDRTPKGVSIHAMDEGIDTGDVLAQLKADDWGRTETLRSSYAKLVKKAAFLFSVQWPKLRENNWGDAGLRQKARGSYHAMAEKTQWMGKLSRGWDTPVTEVEELGSSSRNN